MPQLPLMYTATAIPGSMRSGRAEDHQSTPHRDVQGARRILDMPGMNVRGDQHLNFTPAEAADWLDGAEVRQYAPRHAHPADNDNTIAGVFGVVALGVILTIIGVGFFGSNLRQSVSNAAETSVQPNNAITSET